jgi:hypothetical protein
LLTYSALRLSVFSILCAANLMLDEALNLGLYLRQATVSLTAYSVAVRVKKQLPSAASCGDFSNLKIVVIH